MAEAFVKKIEDFLACAVCFEQLKDPVGLPCLHGFCFECLQNWHRASQNKTQVICPACKNTTPLPKDGIRGFPGHFLVNNLKETVHMEKQKVDIQSEIQVGDKVCLGSTSLSGVVQSINGKWIETEFSGVKWIGKASSLRLVSTDRATSSVPCDLCTKLADSHCLDCKQYLCKQCNKQHNAFKLMKDHKVVAAADVVSGKISSQGRHCAEHGEIIRFYCYYEDKQVCQDCITLKTCDIWHNRVPLSKAAKKQFGALQQLASACEQKKEAYKSSLSKTERIRTRLDSSYQKANDDLDKVITETTEKLQEMFQQKRIMLTEKYSIKDKQLGDTETELKSKYASSIKACTLAENVISHGSDHDITFKYSTLKTTMEGITSSNDEYNINESLGTFSFVPGKPEDYIKFVSPDSSAGKESTPDEIPALEEPQTTQQGPWKSFAHFHTQGFPNLRDVAVFPDGHLVIASSSAGANMYKPNGLYEGTLKCTPRKLNAIAVTPDHRIITEGRSKLLCYNRDGKQLGTITTVSPPVAVAVDKRGIIIAGMYDNMISLHHSNGSQIICFETAVMPYYISTSSRKTLVVTFADRVHPIGMLTVMTYFGDIITDINPPHERVEWDPGYTCCNSRDEIFVINQTSHHFIFRYSHDGQYLGLISSVVKFPKGLTVSSDDKNLIVAEANGTVQYLVSPQ